jgi:hypothetical protein
VNQPAEIGEAQAVLASALAQLGETLVPVLEAVEGYRVARIADGYDDTQARSMAADYHRIVMQAVMRAAFQ